VPGGHGDGAEIGEAEAVLAFFGRVFPDEEGAEATVDFGGVAGPGRGGEGGVVEVDEVGFDFLDGHADDLLHVLDVTGVVEVGAVAVGLLAVADRVAVLVGADPLAGLGDVAEKRFGEDGAADVGPQLEAMLVAEGAELLGQLDVILFGIEAGLVEVGEDDLTSKVISGAIFLASSNEFFALLNLS